MRWGDRPTAERVQNRRKAPRYFRNITEYVLVFAVLFIIFSLVGMGAAFGDTPPVLPTAQAFPTTGGILFPGLDVAAGVNSAALPLLGKATAFQVAVSPPLQTGDPLGGFAGLATSNKKFGLGAGYLGSKNPGSSITHGIFVGGGYDLDPVALGVQIRDLNIQSGVNPGVDLGMILGSGHGTEFGVVLYDVNTSARMDLGVGFADKRYNVEANLLLPRFSNFNSDYVLTAAATVNASIFAMYFRVSYFTQPNFWEETFGGLAWISPKWNVLVQLTTSRTLTAGLTFLL